MAHNKYSQIGESDAPLPKIKGGGSPEDNGDFSGINISPIKAKLPAPKGSSVEPELSWLDKARQIAQQVDSIDGLSYPQKKERVLERIKVPEGFLKETAIGVAYVYPNNEDYEILLKRPDIPAGAVTGKWSDPAINSLLMAQQGAGTSMPLGGAPPGIPGEQPKIASWILHRQLENPSASIQDLTDVNSVINDTIAQLDSDPQGLSYPEKVERFKSMLGSFLTQRDDPYQIYEEPGVGLVVETKRVVIPQDNTYLDKQPSVQEEGTELSSEFKPYRILEATIKNVMDGLTKESYKTPDMKGKPPRVGKEGYKYEVPPGPKERKGDKVPKAQPWPQGNQKKMSIGDSKVPDSPKDKSQPLESNDDHKKWIKGQRDIVEKIAGVTSRIPMEVEGFFNSCRVAMNVLRQAMREVDEGLQTTKNVSTVITDVAVSAGIDYINDILREGSQSGNLPLVDKGELSKYFTQWLHDNLEREFYDDSVRLFDRGNLDGIDDPRTGPHDDPFGRNRPSLGEDNPLGGMDDPRIGPDDRLFR